MAVLYDKEDVGHFAMNHMATHIYQDNAGAHVLFRGDLAVGEVGILHSRHDVIDVSLVRNEPHEKVMVQV